MYNVHAYRNNTWGGGVSIFSRQPHLSKIETLSVCNQTIEVCVAKISIGLKNVIIGIYRPPAGSVESFISEMDQLLQNNLIKNADFVLLAGDFNINLSDTSSSAVNDHINCLNSIHYIPYNETY